MHFIAFGIDTGAQVCGRYCASSQSCTCSHTGKHFMHVPTSLLHMMCVPLASVHSFVVFAIDHQLVREQVISKVLMSNAILTYVYM